MKNPFCKLAEGCIRRLPEKYQGYLLSLFATDTDYVYVPKETFQEMIDIITEKALEDSLKQPTNNGGLE